MNLHKKIVVEIILSIQLNIEIKEFITFIQLIQSTKLPYYTNKLIWVIYIYIYIT